MPDPTPLPRGFAARPFAHRALHGAGRPENSVSAIRAAKEAGYGIEIDVQLSADGRAMVFHDYHLGRLTEAEGPIRSRTAEELNRTRLLGAKGEGVPTLAQVLTEVAGKVPLLIEIKDQDGALGPLVGPLERAVAGDLAGYTGPVAVMSFNPHSVARMADLAPSVARGLTTCPYPPEDWPTVPEQRRAELRSVPDLDATRASFISHQENDLATARVAEIRATGRAIFCWTIRSPEAEAQARRHCDQITFEGYLA